MVPNGFVLLCRAFSFITEKPKSSWNQPVILRSPEWVHPLEVAGQRLQGQLAGHSFILILLFCVTLIIIQKHLSPKFKRVKISSTMYADPQHWTKQCCGFGSVPMFLGLPKPDPLVIGTDPDPSIIKQIVRQPSISIVLWLYDILSLKNYVP